MQNQSETGHVSMIRITERPVNIQCNVLPKQVSLTEIYIENIGRSLWYIYIWQGINYYDNKHQIFFLYTVKLVLRGHLWD